MSRPSRNSTTRFVINASSSAITAILRMTVLVWVNHYLLQRIEPAEYALVPIVASLLVVAELFPNIFLRGLSRFMVEADARKDGNGLMTIASSMFPVLGTVALILLGAGIFVMVHIDDVITVAPEYRTDAQLMLILLVSSLCLRVATTPFRVGLHVRMRFVEQNLVLLASEVLRVVVLLALLLGVSTQVLWVVVSTVVANIANMLVLIGYTVAILPDVRFRLSSVSGATIRRLLGFSLWTLFEALNNLVLRAAPALLLNRHGTAIDVSSFHIGSLADTQIRKLVVAAEAPAKPALTTIYATEGEGALQSFYYRGGRYYLWITMFLLPPLVVFARPLIGLYAGDRYMAAASVMVVILGTYPFIWASAMFYQIAYSVGRIRVFNLCVMAMSAVALAGMWYFVVLRGMGAIGAAYGLGLAYVGVHLLVMWPAGLLLVRGSPSVFLWRTLLPGLAPFGTAAAACAAYSAALPIESWGEFLIGCGVSMLVYSGALFGFCLDEADRQLLVRARRKLTRRRGGKG